MYSVPSAETAVFSRENNHSSKTTHNRKIINSYSVFAYNWNQTGYEANLLLVLPSAMSPAAFLTSCTLSAC